MKYAYEDMSHTQFEELVILICQELFGPAVQGFAEGPDGGRDAKFVGRAAQFPSPNGPWEGTVIVQAKHTNGVNRHFLESDFFSVGNKNSTLVLEVPRIRTLKDTGELTHYILFSNRRLGATAAAEILEYLQSESGVHKDCIYLADIEQIERWLKKFKDVAAMADLDPIDSPLIVSSDQLAIVVEAMGRALGVSPNDTPHRPKPRMTYSDKNKLNGMSGTYAKQLRRNYIADVEQIGGFLSAPENEDILRSYEAAAEEFQLAIIARRRDHQSFDDVMEYLWRLLRDRDPILRQTGHRRLTRAMLFYMYWFCDIGNEDDAAAE